MEIRTKEFNIRSYLLPTFDYSALSFPKLENFKKYHKIRNTNNKLQGQPFHCSIFLFFWYLCLVQTSPGISCFCPTPPHVQKNRLYTFQTITLLFWNIYRETFLYLWFVATKVNTNYWEVFWVLLYSKLRCDINIHIILS